MFIITKPTAPLVPSALTKGLTARKNRRNILWNGFKVDPCVWNTDCFGTSCFLLGLTAYRREPLRLDPDQLLVICSIAVRRPKATITSCRSPFCACQSRMKPCHRSSDTLCPGTWWIRWGSSEWRLERQLWRATRSRAISTKSGWGVVAWQDREFAAAECCRVASDLGSAGPSVPLWSADTQ